MKILYLADAESPHTRKWANYFANKEHKVHLISFRLAKIEGVTVHHIKPPFMKEVNNLLYVNRGPIEKIGYLFCINKVRKLIETIKPDIVHAFLASSYGLMGSMSRFHPFILSVLGSEVTNLSETSLFYRKLVEYNLKKADCVIVTSNFLSHETTKYTMENKKVIIIPFGIDKNMFTIGRKRYLQSSRLTIGTVKTLEEKYGIEYLIRAFKIVLQRFPQKDLSLLIVAGGSLRDKLENLTKELGISDKVKFTGYVPPSKIPEYLKEIDIFVAVSKSESFGVAVAEASVSGIPVVVSNVGGLPEVVINKKTGFLVPPKNPKETAKALIKLIEDQKLCQQMGQAGREFILKNYDWGKNAQKMERLYISMLGSSKMTSGFGKR